LGISNSQARWIVQNRGSGYKSTADLIDKNSPETSQGSSGGQKNGEPLDRQTFARIADRITVEGGNKVPGKININTAPREVLTVLFGGDEQAEQIAYAIITERASLVGGFQSTAELMNVKSVDTTKFKEIADQITVRSNVYTIRCYATADLSGARLMSECVVDRSETPCKILYWYQGANY